MDEYDDDALPRLRSCKKDADDLASLLSGLGYFRFVEDESEVVGTRRLVFYLPQVTRVVSL
jgi:hypothetical protein